MIAIIVIDECGNIYTTVSGIDVDPTQKSLSKLYGEDYHCNRIGDCSTCPLRVNKSNKREK